MTQNNNDQRQHRFERPNISKMTGYSPGEQPDETRTIKLNTNENPYPPSPMVEEALRTLAGQALRRYPNPTADGLRDAVAGLHGIAASQVVITNGGDEALRLAMTTFVEPNSAFGMTEPSYSLYPVLADIHNVATLRLPLSEDWQMDKDFAATMNYAGVQLTCVVNPHAPSGTLWATDLLSQLAEQLEGLLLIDEAYVDFIDPDLNYSSEALLDEHDNVLILRSFSKGYSLAGLRLGYLLGCSGLIEPIINKTRDSYNIDHISQVLGLAAITDQDYARNTWSQIRQERQKLTHNLAQLGLNCAPSQANFLLATVSANVGIAAQDIYHALKAKGILVRYFSLPRLQDKLRISVGTPAENELLLNELTTLLS